MCVHWLISGHQVNEVDRDAEEDTADDEHADVDGAGVEEGAGQGKQAADQHGVPPRPQRLCQVTSDEGGEHASEEGVFEIL